MATNNKKKNNKKQQNNNTPIYHIKINKGNQVFGELSYKELVTTAPERYTEATLLYAMEHAGKYTCPDNSPENG